MMDGNAQKDAEDTADSRKTKVSSGIWVKTGCLLILWIIYGMCGNAVATTYPDLLDRYQVSTSTFSLAITMGSVGAIIGGPLGSVADRFFTKADLILGIIVISNAIAITFMGWSTNIYIFGFLQFIDGLGWSAAKAIVFPLMVNMWAEDGSMAIQALNLGFPIGGVIGPLLAIPFVSQSDSEDAQSIDSYVIRDFPDDSTIEIYYTILGLCTISIGITFVVLQQFHIRPKPLMHNSEFTRKDITWREVFSPSLWSPRSKVLGIMVLVFLSLYYILHSATMMAHNGYQVQFAVESNLTTEQEGALLVSSSYLAGIVSGIIIIPMANVVPIYALVFIFVFGEAIASVMLAFWGTNDKISFWVLSCVLAFFGDPCWSLGYAWTDFYIVLYGILIGIADSVARVFTIALIPAYGYMFDYVSMVSVYYTSAAAGIAFALLAVVMNLYVFKYGDRFEYDKNLLIEQEICVEDKSQVTKL